MTTLTWVTPSGFLFTATEAVSTSVSIVATGTTVSYKVISGSLPDGLLLSTTGTIYGVPSNVIDLKNNKFVIRASGAGAIADRTFSISIEGANDPAWVTPSDFLPVGYNDSFYVFNKQYIKYQLEANTTSSPTTATIQYSIPQNGGKLPPGISLTDTGLLVGYVNDLLSFPAKQNATGGYDTEQFDGFSYDHVTSFEGTVTNIQLTSVPKIYQFSVEASDGVSVSTGSFKILVIVPDMLKPENGYLEFDDTLSNINIISTGSSYLQPPQFVNDADLGTIRANNNAIIDVSAYDPTPEVGPVTYALVTGTTITTQLPDDLRLDSATGIIYGYVPYQPAYTRNYTLTINATKADNLTTQTVTATNIFSLAVRGEVESTINWVTDSNLGSIETGVVSELSVKAQQSSGDYTVKYQLTSGTLPSGINLEQDGSLSGQVVNGGTGTYSFTVLASDIYELSSISKQFTLNVIETDSTEYTRIYVRPFLSRDKRETYREFISNEFTFDPRLMYRFFDSNFGVQPDIKVMLEFGIEKLNLSNYVPALRENFYRKNLYFGDVKVAIAKDSTGTPIYEVVYVDVVDPLIKPNTTSTTIYNAGVDVSQVVYANNEIYYPASIGNMRKQLESIVINNNAYINVNEYNLPVFMRTPQEGEYRPAGYMRVIPLCYALPGQGAKIVSRIKLSGFDFKQLSFEVDRIIVQSSLDNTTDKYLIFDRQALGDTIPEDNLLFGLDGIRLDESTNTPLNRE